MDIVERVKGALARATPSGGDRTQFEHHQEVFDRMKEQGVVKLKGYVIVRPTRVSRKEAVRARVQR